MWTPILDEPELVRDGGEVFAPENEGPFQTLARVVDHRVPHEAADITTWKCYGLSQYYKIFNNNNNNNNNNTQVVSKKPAVIT